MSIASQKESIEKCKQLIESRLDWKDNREWRNRDFQYLSEMIFEKTRISVSVSTLKRIWQNQSDRTPHVSTMNALARFLDFEDWNKFKIAFKDSKRLTGRKPVKKRVDPAKIGKIFGLSLFGIWALVGLFYLLVYPSVKGEIKKVDFTTVDKKDILFTSKKAVTSGLPNSIVFQYDIGGFEFDSAFVQQDWDKRRRTRISPTDNYHTSIYYYPGYYSAKLVLNNTIVKEHPIFIATDGWMPVYLKQAFQEIPVYLKNIDVIKNDRLYISLDDLNYNKIEKDRDFFIGFYNYQDYGNVSCDNFSFETTIKNDLKDGALTCQYSMITIAGERGMLSASFCDPGCISNLQLYFADTFLDGKTNDLSPFGIDLTDWRKIRYDVVDKRASVSVDGKEIYQLTFNRDIGKVIGIFYIFYGCGSVDEAKLFDQNDELVFEDQFESRHLN